jgi:glycosyltransferase involved in cell wall biosynthesis
MAAGLVPIVTNDGSMNSIVSHNENGIIIEKNNSLALSNQIEVLLTDANFRRSISEKAKIFAQTTFSVKTYIHSLNEYYRNSIA